MDWLKAIGIKKADDASQKNKKGDSKGYKNVVAKKPGIVERAARGVGVQAEAISSPEAQKTDRHERIILAWKYLRAKVDQGVIEYYADGSSPILEEYVDPQTLRELKKYLNDLRAKHVYWVFPQRSKVSQSKVTVIDERLGSDQIPVEFTIQERFSDVSAFQLVELKKNAAGKMVSEVVDERIARGVERAILATVEVVEGREYRIISVKRADHAVL